MLSTSKGATRQNVVDSTQNHDKMAGIPNQKRIQKRGCLVLQKRK
jgi:hypothetical protein